MNDPGVFENACGICRKREATQLCDYVIQYDRSVAFFRSEKLFREANRIGAKDESCDFPLCKECAKNVNGADFCPHHFKLLHEAKLPTKLENIRLQHKLQMRIEQWELDNGES